MRERKREAFEVTYNNFPSKFELEVDKIKFKSQSQTELKKKKEKSIDNLGPNSEIFSQHQLKLISQLERVPCSIQRK